jgi:hypothetical protein
MTNEQTQLLKSVISDTFGATCIINLDDDDMSILVEIKRARVLMYFTGVEVETSTGPQMVAGWSIGVLNENGGYEEETDTENFWEMASTVAEMLSEQIVFDYRAQMQDSLLGEQYE